MKFDDNGIPLEDGLTGQVDEVAYHADKGSLSQSGARRLVPPSCPAKFKWLRDNPPPPKPDYDFGHIVHRIVLAKGAEIAVLDPAVHGLTADGKQSAKPTSTAMWKQAAAEARERGEIPVHIADYEAAKRMADAVKSHPFAGPLFEEGHAELSLYATDPETGVRRRGRLDWLRLWDGRNLIVDFKTSTTAHPGEFIRKAADFGYHQQHPWYCDLVEALIPGSDPAFLFVVAEKDPPHLVSVVELDAEAVAEGRQLNRQAIATYAECMERDEWPSYPNNDEVQLVSLQPWQFKSHAGLPTLYDLVDAD